MRLVTFKIFDQSDEETRPDLRKRKNYNALMTKTRPFSINDNKGIRDAGSTADFRILVEIFEI